MTSTDLSGLGFAFPNRSILYESIRNLHFHVPMWFAMIFLMGISVVYSIRTLGSNSLEHDRAAVSAAKVGSVFCALGLITGAVWARATWGAFWTNDVKLNGAAVTANLLIWPIWCFVAPFKMPTNGRDWQDLITSLPLSCSSSFVVPRLNAIEQSHRQWGQRWVQRPGPGQPTSGHLLSCRTGFLTLLGIWMFTLKNRASKLNDQLDR